MSRMNNGQPHSSWSIKSLLGEWIGIDPRALAAFRMSLASILLVDLAIRACDVAAFCAEGGFFPFAAAHRWHGQRWSWSLHLLDGSPEFQAALLVLAAVLAVAMLVGYRTTLAVIGSWAMLISLHNRVPMLLNGGDVLFRLLLFWAMFLPLGRAWSVDALRRRARGVDEGRHAEDRRPVVSVAGVALLLQMCFMYWFTGLFKFNSDWLSGNSMYYVFSFDAYGRPLGRFLLQWPLLCRALTWGTLWLELIGPWLIMLPWPWLAQAADAPAAATLPKWLRAAMRVTGLVVRPAIAVAFIGMHVGIELTMTVGLFSYVSIAGLLPFLPPAFWNGEPARAIAGRWKRWFSGRRQETAAAETGRLAAPILPHELAHAAARARAAAVRRASGLAFGVARGMLCLLLLAYVVWWNTTTRVKDLHKSLSRSAASLGFSTAEELEERGKAFSRCMSALALGQEWSMFSKPTRDDGWFVGRAILADGREVDLLRGGAAVDVDKPADVAGIFPNHRWRKFYRQLLEDGYKAYRQDVALYLGREWNSRHQGPRRAVRVELIYYREKTLLDPRKMRVERVELAKVDLPVAAPPAGDSPDDDTGAAEVAVN
jgi:hypothetical protein